MAKPVENIFKSTTTQNVLLGVLAGGLSADGVVAFIHTVVESFGGTLPSGYDGSLFYISSALLIPLMARIMAHVREWGKGLLGMICVLLCASLALSGCVTMAPALTKPVKVTTEYSDDESGNVVYKQTYVGGAGDIANGATHAKRSWDENGKGEFEVGVNGSSDSTARASALASLGQQQFDLGGQGLNLVGTIAAIAAPLIAQNLQLQNQVEMYKLQNPTESTQDKLLALLGQRLNDPTAGNAWRDWLTQMLNRTTPPAGATE